MTQRAEIERLVEPIARALAIADGKDPDAPAWVRVPGNVTYGICWRDQYADKARAVLQSDALSGLIKLNEELESRIGRAIAVIESGYRGVDKAELCPHDRYGYEDCIGCYDEALLSALSKSNGEGGVG